MTDAGRLVGLDHVQLAIPVDGETEARRFYEDLLGLREVAKPASLAGRGGCWFVGPGVHLHLGVEEPFVPARKAHAAFLVEDLAGLIRRLEAAGAAITPDDSLPGIDRAYVADPFENRIELIAAEHAGLTERR